MTCYQKQYTVQQQDIDELHHVNNITYVTWIQEMSKEHWFLAIKNRISDEAYHWVVANHNITYLRQAMLNDHLILKTFVRKFEGKFSYRVVEVCNEETGKIIMKSETKWCLLDAKSHKSIAISDDIVHCFTD